MASLSLAHVIVSAADPTLQPRVMQWDLTYVGAFRLPAGTSAAASFDYGGTALAYDPQRNGLMLIGHDWYQQAAEINIPTPSTSTTLTSLPVASVIQPFADVLQGHMNDIGSGTAKIGGLLPFGNQLIVSDYLYYDGTGAQTASHFVANSTFSSSTAVAGPYTVSTSLGKAGFVSGSMTSIPSEWQGPLGGSYMTGQCCLAVVSRTSLGPTATIFDPSQLGRVSPVPGKTVVGYPMSNPTLGAWASNSTLYNGTSSVMGMIFPAGTRSVLFIGRQGTGPFCYGAGTSNQALAGTPVGDGDMYCYDPANSQKGTHGYPYVHQVWAYDASDFLAVKAGTKNPWDVMPYATWTMDLPFQNSARLTGGAAYDPATQRLFVIDQGIETANYAYRPIVHVFKLTAGSAAPNTTPTTPAGSGPASTGSTGTGSTPPPPPPPPPPTSTGSTGGTGSTGSTSTGTPCSSPDPYTTLPGTTGICVKNVWVAVASFTNASGTVRVLPNPGKMHVVAIVDAHGRTLVPIAPINSSLAKDGLTVKFSGWLRPDITAPLAGTLSLQVTSISR